MMLEIDEAIGQVENLYRAVTGKQFPHSETPYAPIPAEADPSLHVKQQLDRLIATLGTPLGAPMRPDMQARRWAPTLSIFEAGEDFLVCVDLPGVARENVDVTVDRGVLVIDGQRAMPHPQERRPRVAEQPFGAFHRNVLLPIGLRTEEMNATLKEGVLEVRIPRASNVAAKKIPVS